MAPHVAAKLRRPIQGPTVVYKDNMAAIKLAENAELHERSKHIDIKHHMIRHNVEDGTVDVQWVESANQLADIFTKGLPNGQFQDLRTRLGIVRQP